MLEASGTPFWYVEIKFDCFIHIFTEFFFQDTQVDFTQQIQYLNLHDYRRA